MPPPGQLPERIGTPAAVPAFQAYGKYILVRKLAEGGMAEIFLAKQVGAEGFERNVVIKRMLPHLSQMSDFVRMFLDEARLAAQLNHQNIVQINDLGFADGCYYICMEYLAGEDFSTLLRTASAARQYVPSSVSARVVADAAHGLHFAHEFADGSGRQLKIVHRDVSPSNIFVTYQGGVKVLDFGIVKAEARLTNTTAGVVKGKYMYMSPEQARGTEVDRRADIFSLGVSLYESLTNIRPFSRDSDLAVLNAVLNGEYKRPRELRPDLPEELERIILKAMAEKVEDRYQSAAEMAADLERLLQASSVGGLVQVSQYVQQLFGQERVIIRTRIPTLSTLVPSIHQQSPVLTPTETALAVDVDMKTPATGNRGQTAALRPPRTEGGTEVAAASGRRPAAALGVAVGLALAAIAVVAYVKLFRPEPPVPVPVVQALPPVVVSPPVVLDAGPLPAPAAPDAGALVSLPDAGATVRVQAPDAGTPPLAVKPPIRKPPVKVAPIELGLPDIQKVVSRERSGVMGCFESHKGELPSANGEVTVQFSILASGKVIGASTRGPLAGTGVARCLEQRVTRMRFPAHKDKEVTLALPFEYRVAH